MSMIPASMPLLAESDLPTALIWIALFVVISIGQKVLEWFKKRSNPQSTPEDDDEVVWDVDQTSHERQIRDIIRSLETQQGMGQTTVLQKPVYPEPERAPTVLAPKKPEPPPVFERPARTVTEAAAASFTDMGDATVSARQTLESLSDAEKAALERLKRGTVRPVSAVSPIAAGAIGTVPPSLRAGLANPQMLRAAILYHEILGRPVALRDAP